MSCMFSCFSIGARQSSNKVAPEKYKSRGKAASKTLVNFPIKNLPENVLHYILFPFLNYSKELIPICHSWNALSRNFSFQLLYYKNLKTPIFKTVLNIIENVNDSTFNAVRDRIISPSREISLDEINVQERKFVLTNLSSVQISTPIIDDKELISKDHLEKIEACFELIMRVLPKPDKGWDKNFKNITILSRCIIRANVIRDLNLLTFYHATQTCIGVGSENLPSHLPFLIGMAGLNAEIVDINKECFGKAKSRSLKIASHYTRGFRIQQLITEIPTIVNLYVNIEEINLAGHRILFLPEFTALNKLRVLHLEDNLLTKVSKNIVDSLSGLEELYLQNNLINKIPEELKQFKKLTKLGISGNPFTRSISPGDVIQFVKECLRLDDNNKIEISETLTPK